MSDLRDRMQIYDRAVAPDYWNEVELRAASASQGVTGARPSRTLLLLVAATLLAVAAGGAALAYSRLINPAPNGATTHLAYALDGDIYLAEADGQNPVRIADGEPAGENSEFEHCSTLGGEGPMWSPDGRHLAYRSQWSADCEGMVYLSDAAGQPVASFPGTGWAISWSPDSTRVATWIDLFETAGIYGIDGQRQALLSVRRGCVLGDHDPLWSPDGRSVVAAGCEMPLDGQPRWRLPADDPRSGIDWVYSPDGTWVAYGANPDDSSVQTAPLVIAQADGTKRQMVTYPHDDPTEVAYVDRIVWSPRGDRVAFRWSTASTGGSPTASEVRVRDISTGDETTIATEPNAWPLGFSPAGNSLLVATRDADFLVTEGHGLWAVNIDSSERQLLVPGASWGGWQPRPEGS